MRSPTRVLVLAAIALCAAAGTADARGTKKTKPLPNGTYYGYVSSAYSPFAATVSGGKTSAVYSMAPASSGPGIAYTSTSVKQSASGQWGTTGNPAGVLFEWANPPVCGIAGPGAKIGVSSNCSSASGFMQGKPQFSARRAPSPGPSSGTYSGTVTTQTTKGQSVGTSGTLTLTVANGSVSGTATLAPVNPTTGIASGAPSVNVTYGPIAIGTNQAASGKYASPNSLIAFTGPYLAEDCTSVAGFVSSFLTSQGMFCLPSTPAGYTLIGGFIPGGVPGLATSGLVAGTVATAPTTAAPGSTQYPFDGWSYGPALPGVFSITGATS